MGGNENSRMFLLIISNFDNIRKEQDKTLGSQF
jgi:hypothetical protein